MKQKQKQKHTKKKKVAGQITLGRVRRDIPHPFPISRVTSQLASLDRDNPHGVFEIGTGGNSCDLLWNMNIGRLLTYAFRLIL